jgi:hypothetical protein
MVFAVATISLEQEISKEKTLQLVNVALDFLRTQSSSRLIVCENMYEVAVVIKTELNNSDEYIQIDTQEPKKILVPVIDIETGLEEFIEKKFFDCLEHIQLTTCESRKYDRERNDWSLLLERKEGAEQLVDAFDEEGIFNE